MNILLALKSSLFLTTLNNWIGPIVVLIIAILMIVALMNREFMKLIALMMVGSVTVVMIYALPTILDGTTEMTKTLVTDVTVERSPVETESSTGEEPVTENTEAPSLLTVIPGDDAETPEDSSWEENFNVE